MAGVIRRPSDLNLRKPDMSVVRIVAPVAVVVQIVIADHIMRKILRRPRKIVTVIAILGPGIEGIEGIDRLDIRRKRIRPTECSSLPGAQIESFAAAGGLAFAHADAHHRVAPVRARLYAIAAGLHDRKRLVRRVDLEVIVLAQSAH